MNPSSKAISRRTFCKVTCGAVSLGVAGCRGSMPVAADVASQIDSVLQGQQDDQAAGLSILLRRGAEVVYRNGKGLADAARGLPINAATAFELASVSKPITAMAVMQLVEAGRLSQDDAATRWLKGLPSSWASITIRHLLSHRSGVPDYLSNVPVDQVSVLDGLTNDSLVQRLVQNERLDFAPGSGAAYSSSNYVLLAQVVASVVGRSFAEHVQQQIFEPLDMRSTFVSTRPPPAGLTVALNYGLHTTTWGVRLGTVGDIGITSTVDDLGKLIRAFRAGQVVSLATVQMMTIAQSGKAINASGEYYGLGWTVPGNVQQPTVFAHTGLLAGYRSLMRINQAQNVELLMLSNGGEASLRVINAVRVAVQRGFE